MMFRNYLCESLRLKGENKYISAKYSELITPPPDAQTMERDQEKAEEIIDNLKNKFSKGGKRK